MQIRNDLRFNPDDFNHIDFSPEYGSLVQRIEYKLINQVECPPQYNHSFVIGWTVPGSDVSFKNMDFYFDVGQHETLHHHPSIVALGNYVAEEHATRTLDWELKGMGYDTRSVPYVASYRVHVNHG
ncbi:MAG: hypothetical protein V1944_01305 [Candidatus Aenigmatarchaeota archaeon]